jgi:hypothetical protein
VSYLLCGERLDLVYLDRTIEEKTDSLGRAPNKKRNSVRSISCIVCRSHDQGLFLDPTLKRVPTSMNPCRRTKRAKGTSFYDPLFFRKSIHRGMGRFGGCRARSLAGFPLARRSSSSIAPIDTHFKISIKRNQSGWSKSQVLVGDSHRELCAIPLAFKSAI